jgi:hypothetical protein
MAWPPLMYRYALLVWRILVLSACSRAFRVDRDKSAFSYCMMKRAKDAASYRGGSGDPIVNSSASRLYRLSARQYVHAYLIPCGREAASLYYSVQYGVRVRVRTCVACAAPTWDRGAGRRIIELDRAAIQLSAAVPTDAAGGVGSQYDWR